jgi:hypothetical protein
MLQVSNNSDIEEDLAEYMFGSLVFQLTYDAAAAIWASALRPDINDDQEQLCQSYCAFMFLGAIRTGAIVFDYLALAKRQLNDSVVKILMTIFGLVQGVWVFGNAAGFKSRSDWQGLPLIEITTLMLVIGTIVDIVYMAVDMADDTDFLGAIKIAYAVLAGVLRATSFDLNFRDSEYMLVMIMLSLLLYIAITLTQYCHAKDSSSDSCGLLSS